MGELKKCPFCNGDAEISGRKKIKVICKECGAESPGFDFTSQAVRHWNSRTHEIVKCRDCKYYHSEEKWCDEYSHFEGGEPVLFEENQYCSKGKKSKGDK